MKVIGIKRQKGTYEGRTYDNYVVYAQQNSNNEQSSVICGYCPNLNVKVKAHIMHECVNEDQVKNLLGHEIDCYYDSYKNVCKVFVKD